MFQHTYPKHSSRTSHERGSDACVVAQDGTAIFQATFQGIRETTSFHKDCPFRELSFFGRQAPRRIGGGPGAGGKLAKGALTGAAATDSYQATFVWRIEHFTRLKDLLKKRKITGLCLKSKRFSVGGCTCRLIVYPRGEQPLMSPQRQFSCASVVNCNDTACFMTNALVHSYCVGGSCASQASYLSNMLWSVAIVWDLLH